MACPSDGRLRAYLDGELSGEHGQKVRRHVSRCARCQHRLESLRGLAAWTKRSFSKLEPSPAQLSEWRESAVPLVADPSRATKKRHLWRDLLMKDVTRRARPILAGVALVALLVGLYAFAPTQALARQFLGLFRVEKFAVIEVNPDQAQLEQVSQALEEKLFVGDPEVVVDGQETEVASIDEARQMAGFDARMPSYWPPDMEGTAPAKITVKGYSESVFRFTREGLELFLQMAGMDADIPGDWAEGSLRVTLPSAVAIERQGLVIVQALNPTLEYPEGLEPAVFGEAGLRLLGVSPSEAHRLAETIDWSSTLVLPFPQDAGEYHLLQIAGADAVLLDARDRSEGPRTSVVWEKDDIITVIAASEGQERTVNIAESMY